MQPVFLVFLIGLIVSLILIFKKTPRLDIFSMGPYAPHLEIAARILNAKVEKKRFTLPFTRGYYKNREVLCEYVVGHCRDDQTGIFVSLVPHRIQKKIKVFTFKHSILSPTEKTFLDGKVIRLTHVFPFPECSEKEIIAIFEELTKAAEIVESGSPYFKE